MENFDEKIKYALEIIESGKKVRITGSKHKFYAYSIISNDNGKEYISYTFKHLDQSTIETWGCCDVDYDQFEGVIQKVFKNEPIKVTIKD